MSVITKREDLVYVEYPVLYQVGHLCVLSLVGWLVHLQVTDASAGAAAAGSFFGVAVGVCQPLGSSLQRLRAWRDHQRGRATLVAEPRSGQCPASAL